MYIHHYKKGLFLVLLLIGMPLFTHAQIKQDGHFITISASGGYSNFLNQIPNSQSVGNFGGSASIGYEFQKNFFFMTLGCDFSYLTSTTILDDVTLSREGFDSEGDLVNFQYGFYNFKDVQRASYVSLPVALGFKGNRFYGALGVKVGLSVLGSENIKSNYTTVGVYEQFIDPFYNMPNHYYADYSSTAATSLSFLPNISATAELGVFLGKSHPVVKRKMKDVVRYKFGIFAEYGFSSIYLNSVGRQMITIDQLAIPEVTLKPFLASTNTSSYSINPLFVGVKFTVLFRVESKESCHCLDKGKRRPRSSSKR